jgi:hypothetical protein
MTPRTEPHHPVFADDSERLVWEALVAGLGEHDVLLQGVRFTDAAKGEVEIDLLVLMPDHGAAVVEVKGGHVSYVGGRWLQAGASGAHRIDPARQGRNGVYALREYLESDPAWSRGAVRAAWLIALPTRRHRRHGARADVTCSSGARTLTGPPPWSSIASGIRRSPRVPADGWVEAASHVCSAPLTQPPRSPGEQRPASPCRSAHRRPGVAAEGRTAEPAHRGDRNGRHRQDVAGHGAGAYLGRGG